MDSYQAILHDEAGAGAALGLPAGLTAPMGVAVGRPGPPDSQRHGSPRSPLDELVHWGRWSS